MRMIGFVSLILSVVVVINGQIGQISSQQQRTSSMLSKNSPPLVLQSSVRISFPQCLNSPLVSSLLNPTNIQNLFQIKLQEEEKKLKQERLRNDDLNNSRNFVHINHGFENCFFLSFQR